MKGVEKHRGGRPKSRSTAATAAVGPAAVVPATTAVVVVAAVATVVAKMAEAAAAAAVVAMAKGTVWGCRRGVGRTGRKPAGRAAGGRKRLFEVVRSTFESGAPEGGLAEAEARRSSIRGARAGWGRAHGGRERAVRRQGRERATWAAGGSERRFGVDRGGFESRVQGFVLSRRGRRAVRVAG